MIAATVWVDRLLSYVPWRSAIWIGVMAVVLVMLAARFANAGRWTLKSRNEYKMFAVPPWSNSAIFGYLKTQPANRQIVSNEISPIYFYNGVLAWEPPDKWDYYTKRENKQYDAQMNEMVSRLQKNGGLIVYFAHKLIPYRDDLPTLEELQAVLKTRVVLETPEGVILEVPKAP